jgi:hypothetical protein
MHRIASVTRFSTYRGTYSHAADRAKPGALRFAEALALSADDQWAEVAMAGQLDAWPEQHPRSVIALFSRFAAAAAGLHRVGHGSQNLLSGGL